MKGSTETALIKGIYRDFVVFLESNGYFSNTWERKKLEEQYHIFTRYRNIRISFSNCLFKASRLKRPLLKVRNGKTVKLFHGFETSMSYTRSDMVLGTAENRVNPHARDNTYPRQSRFAQQQKYRRQKTSRKQSYNTGGNLIVNYESAQPLEGLVTTHQKRQNSGSSSRRKDSALGRTVQKPSLDAASLIRNFTDARSQIKSTSSVSAERSVNEKALQRRGSYATNLLTSREPRTLQNETFNAIPNADSQKISPGESNRGAKKRISKDQKLADSEFYERVTISGERPTFLVGGTKGELLKLGQWNIPVETEFEYKSGKLKSNPMLSNRLSAKNYVDRFHLLLHIEELQYRTEIEGYTMRSSTLLKKRSSGLLYLEVPGLAENRPSLLIGDRVYAVRLDGKGYEHGDRYEGFVHNVEKQQVGLGFNSKLASQTLRNMKFSVRFTFNRRPLRLMHRALDILESTRLAEMLFPSRGPEPYTPKEKLFMRKREIESNMEQRTAVENIVLGKTPPIYIIFGPPGTGKTVTMVEAIYQTQKRYNFNILVCALCNDACDMLASKLQDYVDKNKMIRLYAASRSWGSVPQKIKSGNTNFQDGVLCMPDQRELMKYRIIICTFVTAGRIASMKFPNDHFQRIFIDESGQAFEPECLVAVSGILAPSGKLILAGDPKQLGPIVRSPLAIRHGLQQSLLERLMNNSFLYQKNESTGKYNPQCVTKLVKNFRSHDVILRISNQHFYDRELLVYADQLKRTKMCGWEWLPNKSFPIIFHGIEGKQTRDESSPSYYNPDEVKIVKDYVQKLMEARGTHKLAAPSDIGIVTPYRKQCEKIRKSVEKFRGIDVGSVEVFQGQERPVIIISTVRSSKEGLTDDAKYHLGFLCDPKRFNVALTRAQALLIIIGNPRLLSLDKHWKSLLVFCMENKAYRGAKFTESDFRGASDMKEIEELFKKIDISDQEVWDNEDDLAAPFWRKEH